MPLPIIAGVVRGTALGITSRGTPWVNVMNFRFTGGGSPTQADLDQLAADIRALYHQPAVAGVGNILGHCKTTTTLQTVKVLPLDGSSASSVYSTPEAGAQADDELPSQSAPVVTLRTGLRGPRHRGRIYLPPWTEGGSNGIGQIAAGDITATNASFVAWQTLLETHSWECVVASYKWSDWHLVTSFQLNPDFCVQRRRRN